MKNPPGFAILYGMAQGDGEVKDLLEKNLELNEENNKMLRGIERRERWSRILSIAYWVVLIGSALGAYYFLQPYIDSIRSLFQALPGAQSVLESFKNTSQ